MLREVVRRDDERVHLAHHARARRARPAAIATRPSRSPPARSRSPAQQGRADKIAEAQSDARRARRHETASHGGTWPAVLARDARSRPRRPSCRRARPARHRRRHHRRRHRARRGAARPVGGAGRGASTSPPARRSRSSKLIHGGVRYLQQGDVGLVREAASERARAASHRAAPGAIPLLMVMPTYGRGMHMKLGVGLWTFEKLASVDADERHEMWDRAEALAAASRCLAPRRPARRRRVHRVPDRRRPPRARDRRAARPPPARCARTTPR